MACSPLYAIIYPKTHLARIYFYFRDIPSSLLFLSTWFKYGYSFSRKGMEFSMCLGQGKIEANVKVCRERDGKSEILCNEPRWSWITVSASEIHSALIKSYISQRHSLFKRCEKCLLEGSTTNRRFVRTSHDFPSFLSLCILLQL